MAMKLIDVIGSLRSLHSELCIVARRPWSPAAEAKAVYLTMDGGIPPEVRAQGFEYFLEVSIAVDDVVGSLWDVLTDEQRFEAVLYYAENDTYPSWLNEFCRQRDLPG